VLGQRPMSQRRDTLNVIERESGLAGLLLRPLSAQHFNPTIPEQEGWVDRSRLLAIQGRSRKEQMQLASDLEVTNYPCPAGGCLLTEVSFVSKVRDVFDHAESLNLRDFRMLKVGRHFRIGPRTKVIIGRDEADNHLLEHAVQAGEATLRWLEGSSPLGLVTGAIDPALLETAAGILLRYTKADKGMKCAIHLVAGEAESSLSVVNDFTEERIEALRI
jgi:tRNA-uridine 2-sulfurtransferase